MKKIREVATCSRCLGSFTRVRVFHLEGSPGHAPETCPRCLKHLDLASRKASIEAAIRRWDKTIKSNDSALQKCLDGTFTFSDERTK